ncbi:hypothetical protein MHU86_17330 [Fragilaria crotonensis]|nr:hypothetical protein MHU86_17330 [Fragilaria crotonensis]
MAVDRQIRISIANIFTQDWSKVVAMPVREPDLKSRRRVGSKQVLQSPKSPVRHKAPKFHSFHGVPPAPDDVDAPLSPSPGVVKTPPRSPSSPPNTPMSRDSKEPATSTAPRALDTGTTSNDSCRRKRRLHQQRTPLSDVIECVCGVDWLR